MYIHAREVNILTTIVNKYNMVGWEISRLGHTTLLHQTTFPYSILLLLNNLKEIKAIFNDDDDGFVLCLFQHYLSHIERWWKGDNERLWAEICLSRIQTRDLMIRLQEHKPLDHLSASFKEQQDHALGNSKHTNISSL